MLADCQVAGGSRETGFGAAFFFFGFGAGLSPEGVAAGFGVAASFAAAGFGVAASFAAAGFAVFFLSGFVFDSSDTAPGAGGFVPV